MVEVDSVKISLESWTVLVGPLDVRVGEADTEALLPSAEFEGLEAIVLDLVAYDLGEIFVIVHVMFVLSHREVEV